MSVESPSVLDTCFADLPLHQSIGDQLQTRFTPLRTYEGFASDVCERAGKEERYEEQKADMKKGLFYLLKTTVEYDGMTQQDLLTIWAEEAKEAIDAKRSGILDVWAWKVVAERKFVAVICVQDPAEVDRLTYDLPIFKKMGNRLHVECKSILPIEEWVEDLKKLAE